MARRLLVGVGKLEERLFRPGAAVEGHARREDAAAGKAHRDVEGGEARGWREELAVVSVGRIEVADQPRGIAPGRIDKGVQLELSMVFRTEARTLSR